MLEFREGRFCVGVWYAAGVIPLGGGPGDVLMGAFRDPDGTYDVKYRLRYYHRDSISPGGEGDIDRKSWFQLRIKEAQTPEQVWGFLETFARVAFSPIGTEVPLESHRIMGDSLEAMAVLTSRPWCHYGGMEDGPQEDNAQKGE